MLTSDFTSSGTAIRATDFNANVASVRQATVSPGAGMLVDNVPMGGTIISPLSQKRMIRSKAESAYLPFTLKVVNVGTKANPVWKKIVYVPEGACDVCGGWAECENDPFSGSPVWAQSGDWYYISDASGASGSSHIPDQNSIEYVFMHVKSIVDDDGPIRSVIITNSKVIPNDFEGHETDCICLGRFKVQSAQEISQRNRPRLLEQYVSGQVQVYGDLFPFKLHVASILSGTNEMRVKVFYVTDGAVFCGYDQYAECLNDPLPYYEAGSRGFYLVHTADGTEPAAPSEVYNAYLHVKYDADSQYAKYIVTCDDEVIPDVFQGKETACICIGKFTCPASADQVPEVIDQFVTSQVQVNTVAVQDNKVPFKLVAKKLSQTENGIVCFNPMVRIGNVTAIIDNEHLKDEQGHDVGGWFVVDTEDTTGTVVYANIATESESTDEAPHVYLSTSPTVPEGYGNTYRIFVGVVAYSTRDAIWSVVMQYAIGNKHIFGGGSSEPVIQPFTCKWVPNEEYADGGSIWVYVPLVCLSANGHAFLWKGRAFERHLVPGTRWYDMGDAGGSVASDYRYVYLNYHLVLGGGDSQNLTYNHTNITPSTPCASIRDNPNMTLFVEKNNSFWGSGGHSGRVSFWKEIALCRYDKENDIMDQYIFGPIHDTIVPAFDPDNW